MVKIELLIPLSYFGIVRTLSTGTIQIAHFVIICLLSFFLSSDCSERIVC